MFGLRKKKEEVRPFFFELEKEVTQKKKKYSLIKHISQKTACIKDLLEKGCTKEDFEHLSTLLNGYHALIIVLSRVAKKAEKSKK